MQITANEIDTIEEAGMLNNMPVKMIRTKGGFYICVGSANGQREEALAAGSHPAIVKYNLEKQYPGFQPSMMKSAHFADAQVEKHSHFLTEELRKSGHDILSVQNETGIEFHVTKHGMSVGQMKSRVEDGTLVVKGIDISKMLQLSKSLQGTTLTVSVDNTKDIKEFSRALAGATTEKALSCGVSKVRIEK